MKKVFIILFVVILIVGGWFIYANYFEQSGKSEFEQDKKMLSPGPLAFKYDPLRRIGAFQQLELRLDMYHKQEGSYPKKLSELSPPTIVSSWGGDYDDFFYAYYPTDNPQNYHLGIELSGELTAEYARKLDDDSDFNSKDGFVDGFDGSDPIYDSIK